MNHKKSVIVCCALLIIFLLIIFIEVDDGKNDDASNDEEILYLSYEEPPVMMQEPLPVIEPIVEPIAEVLPAPIIPDLGRLAITSVMINKKITPKEEVLETTQEVKITQKASQQKDLSYKILQGQRFSAVLTHAIHSDLPGIVVAELSQNVYGYQSYIPLLPTGTRLVGHYNSRLAIGDTRLYIVWQRAITPAGIDIQLDSAATDRLGQTGSTGVIDNHFWEIFGTSSLLSVMAVGASNLSPEQGEMSNQYQQGVTDALMDTSNTILNDRIKRRPTIHIPQGEIIHVMVEKDLDFSQVLKEVEQIPVF